MTPTNPPDGAAPSLAPETRGGERGLQLPPPRWGGSADVPAFWEMSHTGQVRFPHPSVRRVHPSKPTLPSCPCPFPKIVPLELSKLIRQILGQLQCPKDTLHCQKRNMSLKCQTYSMPTNKYGIYFDENKPNTLPPST